MSVELAARPGLIGRPLVNGLQLPPDITLEEWASAIRHADAIVESSPWWLADLMAYGETKFGQRHSQMLPTPEEDPTGVSQSRMKQAAWMASKYPRNQRVEGLSYTHHRLAAELEPEARIGVLRAAVEASPRWSTRELDAVVKEKQQQARAIEAHAEPAPSCAAESVWRPTPDDLTEQAAAQMRFERTMAGKSATFEAGWVAALAWLEALDCFQRSE